MFVAVNFKIFTVKQLC